MKSILAAAAIPCLTLNTLADPIDQFITEQMAQRDIPGLALKIVQAGADKKTAAYGFANLEWNIPATEDTVFEIGSITKQFTAALVLMLAEDGRLALDDPIGKHLPKSPAAWNPVTIRHLLHHTSGVKTYTGLDGFELTKRLTQEQFIDEIGVHPLDFPPGDSYKYSNTGYSLLGYIIENVSGKSYWDFLGERIVSPLGMSATTNREPRIVIPKRAGGYEKDKQKKTIHRDYDLTDINAAGAMVSTVGDLARWSAALDGDKVLSRASKEQMWTTGTRNDGRPLSSGLGWRITEWHGQKVIGHSGSTSGFSATFQRFPEHDLAIIILCNSGEINVATDLAKEVALFYLAGDSRGQ